MKKINKYLTVIIVLVCTIFIGMDGVKAEYDISDSISPQKKTNDEIIIKKYANGDMGIWNPSTAQGIGVFSGTMPNPIGIRVTIIDKDGKRQGKTIDYVGSVPLGISGKVYYNGSSNNYKTAIVNNGGRGLSFNSQYFGGGSSMSNITIASKKYGNIIDSSDPKAQIFNQTKEALDSNKVPTIFSDTGFCTEIGACKKQITGENSFKYYILIEPIIAIDLYTGIYGTRMILNYTELLDSWAYRGEGHKRYYGTPTELATILEKTDKNEVKLNGDGYTKDLLKIDCNKLGASDAIQACIAQNGDAVTIHNIYFQQESNKNSTFGFSYFLNYDAGVRGTGGALLLQLNDRPWIDDMNYSLNSKGSEYTIPVSMAGSYPEMYTTTKGYAMNIIWFAAFSEDQCNPEEITPTSPFNAACCNDTDYLNSYFKYHTGEEPTKACCDVAEYKNAFQTANPSYDWDAFDEEYCQEKPNPPLTDGACLNCTDIVNNAECGDDDTGLFAACKQVLGNTEIPETEEGVFTEWENLFNGKLSSYFPSIQTGQYGQKIQSCQPTQNTQKYLDTNRSNEYCQTYCFEIVNTDFDSTPTVYITPGSDNEDKTMSELLAGTYFTWGANIKGAKICKTEIDWESFISDYEAAYAAVYEEYVLWTGPEGQCNDWKYNKYSGAACETDGGVIKLDKRGAGGCSTNVCANVGNDVGDRIPGSSCEPSYNSCCTGSRCSGGKYDEDGKCVGGSDTCSPRTGVKWEQYTCSKSCNDCKTYQHHCGKNGERNPSATGFDGRAIEMKKLYDRFSELRSKIKTCVNSNPDSYDFAPNVEVEYSFGDRSYMLTPEVSTTSNYLRCDRDGCNYTGGTPMIGIGETVIGTNYTDVNIEHEIKELQRGNERITVTMEEYAMVNSNDYIGLTEDELFWQFNTAQYPSESSFIGYRTLYRYIIKEAEYKLPEGLNRIITADGEVKDGVVIAHATDLDDKETAIVEVGSNEIDVGMDNFTVPFMTVTGTYDFTIKYTNVGENAKYDKQIEENNIPYTCQFEVKNRIIKEPDDCPDCPEEGGLGGINVIYRTIDLVNPFPGIDNSCRNTGWNWCAYHYAGLKHYTLACDPGNIKSYDSYEGSCGCHNEIVQTFILENRGVSSYEIYKNKDIKPLYTITLTPSTIKKLREYNETYDYGTLDTSNYSCDSDGTHCRSKFISEFASIDSGYQNNAIISCFTGTDGNGVYQWNSCSGWMGD